MRSRVREAIENRERFTTAARALGLSPLPSSANFVLIPVADAPAAAAAMRAAGVAVRPFVQLAGIGDALRVTIGPWDMMNQAIVLLRGARTS
jgi:histidinol-phosphate aminotransferase